MGNKLAGWLLIIWGIVLIPATIFGGEWTEDVIIKRVGVIILGVALLWIGVNKLRTDSLPKDGPPKQPE